MQILKLKILLFAIGLSFSSITWTELSDGLVYLLKLSPPPQTSLETLRYLIGVQKFVPTLFKDASTYDVDLSQLLEDQRRVLEFLNNKKTDAYQKAFESLPDYRTLVIRRKANSGALNSAHFQTKKEAIESWKRLLQETLDWLGTLPGITSGTSLSTAIDLGLKTVDHHMTLRNKIDSLLSYLTTKLREKDPNLALDISRALEIGRGRDLEIASTFGDQLEILFNVLDSQVFTAFDQSRLGLKETLQSLQREHP